LQQEKEAAAAHANEGFLHETYQRLATCGPGGNVEKDRYQDVYDTLVKLFFALVQVKLVLGPPPSVYANRAFRRSCGGGPKREDHRLGLWWAVFYILGDSLLFVWRGAWLNSPFLKTTLLLRQILSSYTCASISERDRLLFFKSYVAGIFFGLDLSTLVQVLSQELYSPFSSEKSTLSGYQFSHLYLNLAYYTMVLVLELLADSHAPGEGRWKRGIPICDLA
jgi:hypothetical protein